MGVEQWVSEGWDGEKTLSPHTDMSSQSRTVPQAWWAKVPNLTQVPCS